MLEKRAALPAHQKQIWDAWFCDSLLEYARHQTTKILHAYWPMGSEPDIRPALTQLLAIGWQIFLPKVLPNRQMVFLLFDGIQNLTNGRFGTVHPQTDLIFDGSAKMVLVPGLAFTASGKRLGYGGGFYDTWLAHHKTADTIALAYPFQICDALPTESHDQPIGQVWIPK